MSVKTGDKIRLTGHGWIGEPPVAGEVYEVTGISNSGGALFVDKTGTKWVANVTDTPDEIDRRWLAEVVREEVRTPEQIAAELYGDGGSIPLTWAARIQTLMAEAIEADRAQRFADPDLTGLHLDAADIFENAEGDRLLEVSNPLMRDGGEVILVRSHGPIATLRGAWEKGYRE